MARKPGPGICVHCLKEVPKRNWDHVFPQGWYPDTTPENLEKWKIPTCKRCNDEYGRIEEDLGIMLSACINPETAQASGIWKKTLRALDPSYGKNEKDKRARERKKRKLLKLMRRGDEIPDHGIYPGLGERWGRPRNEQVALPVPAKHLQKLAEKIVKGLAFIEDGQLVDANTGIEYHVANEEGAQPIVEALEKFGKGHSRGPGIEVIRAVTPDDGVSGFYKITVWGELVMYVTVLRKTVNRKHGSDPSTF
ncbi:MAG: hypothetical protein ACC651_11940 [Candidatus Scalindua sp.]